MGLSGPIYIFKLPMSVACHLFGFSTRTLVELFVNVSLIQVSQESEKARD